MACTTSSELLVGLTVLSLIGERTNAGRLPWMARVLDEFGLNYNNNEKYINNNNNKVTKGQTKKNIGNNRQKNSSSESNDIGGNDDDDDDNNNIQKNKFDNKSTNKTTTTTTISNTTKTDDGKDSNILEDGMNVNDTIRNMTAHHRIIQLVDLLPKIVALSKKEAQRKRKQMEDEISKKTQIDRDISKCPSVPLPPSMKKGLSQLIDVTVTQNCSRNSNPRTGNHEEEYDSDDGEYMDNQGDLVGGEGMIRVLCYSVPDLNDH